MHAEPAVIKDPVAEDLSLHGINSDVAVYSTEDSKLDVLKGLFYFVKELSLYSTETYNRGFQKMCSPCLASTEELYVPFFYLDTVA